MLKPKRNYDNLESTMRYKYVCPWALFIEGENFIQDKQAKINKMVAEYT